MLEVRARKIFSSHYEILDVGQVLTTVNIRWWREAGKFKLDGEQYTVGRRGLASGLFYVERDGELLASANKPSAFFNRFTVDYDGQEYELSRRSFFGRAFDLKLNGSRVGSMNPTSIWTRSARVHLPNEITAPVQVFITWLVLVLWRRMQQSNAGS
ncbi:MAG TPA: hypothetical protein EYQ25_03940 [Planctomycetes bacterium]|nr:hypothetical protein [Planctomycetota bacterium]HIL37163.1 hypothetical protein [Planctomycetota bacterium]